MSKVTLQFNTVLYPVSKIDGKPDEALSKRMAIALRGQLMQIDGVLDVSVFQSGVDFEYSEAITNAVTIENEAAGVVDWAAGQGDYFPYRGNKTPRLFNDRATAPQVTNWVCVTASVNTSVAAFTPKGDYNRERNVESFSTTTNELAKRLANADGVVGCNVGWNRVVLTFDKRYNNEIAIEVHMDKVLRAAKAQNMDGIFPFIIDAGELAFTFTVTENVE